MSKITVSFFTWAPEVDSPRTEYAVRCLSSVIQHLKYDGELAFHIADDGSPEEHRKCLLAVCEKYGVKPTISNTGHAGYGANYNLSTQWTHPDSDMILALEDDWEMVRDFDLTELANVLMSKDEVRCIRLGRIGWTGELRGKLVQIEGYTLLLFDPNTPEFHVFAGAPRLETVDFERDIGPWPEGIRAGETEVAVCRRPQSRVGVAWPMDSGINASELHSNLFIHIGDVKTP